MRLVYFAQVAKPLLLCPLGARPSRRPTIVTTAVGGPFGDGPIKIGVTGALPERLRAVACKVEQPLALLGAFPGDRTAERAMHETFAHLRLGTRGPVGTEWFRPAWELTCFIASLPSIDANGMAYGGSATDRDYGARMSRASQAISRWLAATGTTQAELAQLASRQLLRPVQQSTISSAVRGVCQPHGQLAVVLSMVVGFDFGWWNEPVRSLSPTGTS